MKWKLLNSILTQMSCTIICIAQNVPVFEWQNTIGGSNGDNLNSVIQTIDHGYLLVGNSWSGISGDKSEANLGNADYWVVKLDSSGNIIWQKTIGGSNEDHLNTAIQIEEGGFILAGYSNSDSSSDKSEDGVGNYDYWVIKIDPDGSIIWQNTIGGMEDDYLNCVIGTADEGYLLGGSSNSDISGDKTEMCQGGFDYWVVKLDKTGNIIWQNTIGGNDYDDCKQVIKTSNGNYLLGGHSSSDISGDKTDLNNGGADYWIVEIGPEGNLGWQNTIGGDDNDYLNAVIHTSDGGYLLGGSTHSSLSGDKTEGSQGGYDYWIIKAAANGNISWQNTIGGSSYDDLTTLISTTDSGYLIGGFSRSQYGGDKTEGKFGGGDYWIVKLDLSGNIQWQNSIGGKEADFLSEVVHANDGGYILGGTSSSEISEDKNESCLGSEDYWIIKTTPEYGIGISEPQDEKIQLTVFPNPSDEIFLLTLILGDHINTEAKIEVINLFGQVVYDKTSALLKGRLEEAIKLGDMADGMYLVRVMVNDQVYCRQIVYQK